jgi:hypothetical protein
MCWKSCSSCWSFHLILEEFLSAPIHSPPPSLVRRIGPSILQYADGTVIFLDHDLKQAKTLKLLLCAFEQLSVLKINFHKSEVFCCGAAREMEDSYTPLFGCNSGDYLSDI